MTPTNILIRRAEPADTGAAKALMAVRNRSEAAAAEESADPDLENPRRKVWLAFDGQRAIAMTSVQERQLTNRKTSHRVAYWTGLFVDPDYRQSLIYPQLLLAMFKGLRQCGIHHIYAAVRRQQVAEAHEKVGFRKIGQMQVLLKPLRPTLLLAKYRGITGGGKPSNLIRSLCAAPDGLIRSLVRFQCRALAGIDASMSWTAETVEDLSRLYRESCGEMVMQDWNPDTLRDRYDSDRRGYRFVGIRHGSRLRAAAILRVVERSDGIRAAVIMDIIHAPMETAAAVKAIAAAELHALANDCDTVLLLNGPQNVAGQFLRGRGYLKSPEKYTLLIWLDRGTELMPFSSDLRSWRFAFGDHDTF